MQAPAVGLTATENAAVLPTVVLATVGAEAKPTESSVAAQLAAASMSSTSMVTVSPRETAGSDASVQSPAAWPVIPA